MQPFRDLMPRDREAFAAMIDQAFGNRLLSTMRTRLLANDLDVLRVLTQNRESNADGLPSMIMPCLLFVGELDPRLPLARQCASVLPNATLFTLPECDHAAASIRSELVMTHLKAFLAMVHG